MEKKNVITFGSSLAALQFAYQNKTKIVLNNLHFPLPFEPSHIKHAWGLLYTKLLLGGQSMGGDGVKTAKITDDEVFVVCEGNVVNRINYDLAVVFDDKNLLGLPGIQKETDEYLVVDKLQPIYLTLKNLKTIHTPDDLVKTLYIMKEYSTAPIRLYSISKLKKHNLIDFEYSDTMVKFKCEHLLSEKGHGGGATAHLLLDVINRTVIKKMDIYEPTEKIQFIYD